MRKYVILVRTIFSDKGVPSEVLIDINGKFLRDALLAINKNSQDEVFDDKKNPHKAGRVFRPPS